jgi:hypothetical protein
MPSIYLGFKIILVIQTMDGKTTTWLFFSAPNWLVAVLLVHILFDER